MSRFAICTKARVVYHPAPKNAGSSMRQHLFTIENGRPYESMIINGKRIELFMIYGQPGEFSPAPAIPGYARFALVRDPAARLLSAYANRVLDPRWRNRNHEQLCASLDLPPLPDIETFIANLDRYRKIPEIAHHTRSQRFFLGVDLSYYDVIFKVESIGEAVDYLAERSGVAIDFPSLKTDGPKARKCDLKPDALGKIHDLFREDYTLLSNFYPL